MHLVQVIICAVGILKFLTTQPAEMRAAFAACHVVAAIAFLDGRPAPRAGLCVLSLPDFKLTITLTGGKFPRLVPARTRCRAYTMSWRTVAAS